MGSGEAKCRDCGGRLLGIEVAGGRCGYCERALEAQVRPVVSQPVKRSLTPVVVSQEPEHVVSPTKSRQQRWREAHRDQWRTIHRDGQRRRRAE